MLFPIFVIATLAELYVLMTIGSSIGAGNTILLVVITAFIGTKLRSWSVCMGALCVFKVFICL
jgi:UPF0716 protein FxsA